jgi:hypothetical protein
MKFALILTPETNVDDVALDRMLLNYHWKDLDRIDDLRNHEPHAEPQVIFHGRRYQDCIKVATAFGATTIR